MGKKKNDDKVITAIVWLYDVTVYEGPLVKHWFTHRQTNMPSKHNFLDFIDNYLTTHP